MEESGENVNNAAEIEVDESLVGKAQVEVVMYRSNNSGGSWWLTDQDWKNLESAGWKVQWVSEDPLMKDYLDSDGSYMGELATSAYREGLSLYEAKEEFYVTTGQDPDEEGCQCCGQPHNFYTEWVDV